MAGALQPVVYVIAGTAQERTPVARLLAERVAGRHVEGDAAAVDDAAARGATVVLEVDVPAPALGPLRTSIAHRPCHIVVIAADGGDYAGGGPRVGIWIDPAGRSPDATVDAILERTPTDREPIVIADYDPAWPRLFERLAAPVRATVADLGASVEHVGSTAVPGLAAKPIVDMDVVVRDAADVPAAIERLRRLGYVYQGDKGIAGREAFLWPPGAPVHHLYVVVAGNAVHSAHVRFRDLLRERPDVARDYSALKRLLAERHGSDRVAYTDAKSAFIAAAITR